MADNRHKRDTPARRLPRPRVLAGSFASLATLSVVGIGVLTVPPASVALLADDPADPGAADTRVAAAAEGDAPVLAAERGLVPLSRSAVRGQTIEEEPTALERVTAPAAVREAVDGADDEQWSTTELDIWTGPGDQASADGLLDDAEKVLVTGRTFGGREEIVLDGDARWVTAGYLAQDKPEPEPATGTEESTSGSSGGVPQATGASCSNGSSVPSGVSPNIVAVHQAVCAAFPSITSYGTFRSDGEHAQGIAIDIMVSGETGYQVADFVRANAGSLGVSYAIYAQRIWSVERGGEGWRGMSDRGSTTANHYDHVHVTTY